MKEQVGNHSHFGSPTVWDWFLPAIEADRTVRSSLDSVVLDLEVRSEFVKVLRDRLCDHSAFDSDSLTALIKEARFVQTSIQSRLGFLDADRVNAWFRPAIMQSVGPFSQNIIRDAMISTHAPEEIESIRSELENLWKSSSLPSQRWTEPASVWGRILQLNHRYDQICRMDGKYCSGLRLDQLPDALPERLGSALLRGFLNNVRAKTIEARSTLDSLRTEMMAATEKLWDAMRQQSEARKGSRMHRHTETAQRAKDEFRERRQSARARSYISESVRGAMQVMRLTELPDSTQLKKRYLELARECHPDHHPGKDDEFKRLAEAYSFLSKRIISTTARNHGDS